MRKPFTNANDYGLSKAEKTLPRVITMGGHHPAFAQEYRQGVWAYYGDSFR